MEIAELTMDDEAPIAVLPDIPYASENYAWCGYDPKTRAGFFSHMGRWSLDTRLWREQLYVYLPDGTVLVHRNIGGGNTPAGPQAAFQKHVCTDPGKHWRLTHRGPVQRFATAEMLAGQPKENFPGLLDLSVEFHGDTPVFFYPKGGSSAWGRWHYEQLGRMDARIEYDGQTYEISGFAFRDHSRGPRNLANFGGSNWIQGRFDNDTGFALFQNWRREGDAPPAPALTEFVFIGRDSIEECRIIEAPPLADLDLIDTPIRLVVDSPSRGRVELRGMPHQSMVFSVSDRHEILYGAARDRALGVVVEQTMTFEGGGLSGSGHCERSRLLTATSPRLDVRQAVPA